MSQSWDHYKTYADKIEASKPLCEFFEQCELPRGLVVREGAQVRFYDTGVVFDDPDGRVFEGTPVNRGMWWTYVAFASELDWRSFSKTLPMHMYFHA